MNINRIKTAKKRNFTDHGEILNLKEITQHYTSGQSIVIGLEHVSMTFRRGEFVAITGESGSEKTTLGRIVAGILPYKNGELYINGHSTSHYDSGDLDNIGRRKLVMFRRTMIFSQTVQCLEILPVHCV